jgi:CRISPR/Cas system-associated protein endoribonuclease Cas2
MSEKEISMGTLYELNKNVIMQTDKALKPVDTKDKLKKVAEFFKNSDNQYCMLLCREKYDFTLFNFLDKGRSSLTYFVKELKECLDNRGVILSIELTENKDAYEIWLMMDDEAFVYYLFPYDLGVIEIGV